MVGAAAGIATAMVKIKVVAQAAEPAAVELAVIGVAAVATVVLPQKAASPVVTAGVAVRASEKRYVRRRWRDPSGPIPTVDSR